MGRYCTFSLLALCGRGGTVLFGGAWLVVRYDILAKDHIPYSLEAP